MRQRPSDRRQLGTQTRSRRCRPEIERVEARTLQSALPQVAAASGVVAPSVVSLQNFGFHMQRSSVVLTFTTALDATSAENVNNYHIVTVGGSGHWGSHVGHITPILGALYNPANFTVTVYPFYRLDIHNFYRLIVTGSPKGGVKGATGLPLDGKDNGVPGTNYVAVISSKTLAGPFPTDPPAAQHRSADRPPLSDGTSASAVDAHAAASVVTPRPDARSNG
jgi:hypothetical protein